MSYEGTCRRRCDEETQQEISKSDGISVETCHLSRLYEWMYTTEVTETYIVRDRDAFKCVGGFNPIINN